MRETGKGETRTRSCIARVTGCNRCYQVEVSGQIHVRCLHLTGFGRKHKVREIVRIEEMSKRERERENEGRG